MGEVALTIGILALTLAVILGVVAWARRRPSPDQPTGSEHESGPGTRDRPGGPGQESQRPEESELHPDEPDEPARDRGL